MKLTLPNSRTISTNKTGIIQSKGCPAHIDKLINGFSEKLKPLVFLLLTILLDAPAAHAQDDHYWSQQYGAESTLLGGAMVGGVSDNSAVYYNPGALAFITNLSLSIDANVYRMDKILISDGAGKGLNLNSAQISIYPQIISGMVKSD